MKKKVFFTSALCLLFASSVVLTGCLESSGTSDQSSHAHAYAESWSSDETHHWKLATCGHDEKGEEGAHTWNGEHKCTVCDYQGEHDYDKNWECVECSFAYVTAGLKYTLSEDGNSYAVTDFDETTDKHLVIPSEYEGKPVTAIGEWAFSGSDFLTAYIPDSVLSIEANAFYNNIRLISVTLGEGIESIADLAFLACDKLVEVYNLSSLTIVKGDTRENGGVGGYALDIYTSLEEESRWHVEADGLIFYDGETENYLLGGVDKVEELVLPTSYQGKEYSIYQQAFAQWETLASVTVSDGITAIGEEAFYDCANLRNVSLGKDLTVIGRSAFALCKKLHQITIPQGVTEIGAYAFASCEGMIEVYNLSALPITVGSGDYGYAGYFVKNVATTEAERGIFTTTDEGYVFYELGEAAYLVDYVGSNMELTLPETCNGKTYEIYRYAFYKREDLQSLVIPDGVTAVGDYAFYFCTGLQSIRIGNGVTVIRENGFRGCGGIKAITIGSGLESIESRGLQDLGSLTDIHYAGSKESWNAISKGQYWDILTDGYTVHCTDGDIEVVKE